MEFGERIVGLSAGEVVFDGPPDELTDDVVHRIYPGLDDPGVARVAAAPSTERRRRSPPARRHRGRRLKQRA